MATDSSRSAGTWIAVASLFSSLALYVVLSHHVLDLLGDTIYARTAVTVAFLLTTAVGAVVGGRVRYRRAEVALALYGVGFPLLLPWLGELYLVLAPSITDASLLARNGARVVLGLVAFAVPGFLTGVTVVKLENAGATAAGAAIGLVVAHRLAIPLAGLTATIVLAACIKLVLSRFSPRAPETRYRRAPLGNLALANLPWRTCLVVASLSAIVAAIAFFRSLLAFALQHPTVLPAVAGGGLVAFVLVRRGFEIPVRAVLLATAFASGGALFTIAAESLPRTSPTGLTGLTSLGFAVAVGALLGSRVGEPRRWIVPALTLAAAAVLVALAAAPTATLVAASAVGVAVSLIVSATGHVGPVYAAGASGAVVAIVVASTSWGSLGSNAVVIEGDEADGVTAAYVAAMLTPERTRALVAGGVDRHRIAALGFETVVCAPEAGSTGLHEDPRSVLFESASRYDVIAVGEPASRELYRLASERLRRHGVLVIRLSLDRLSPREVFLAVSTAKAVLAHASVWSGSDAAFVFASNEPLLVDLESVRSEWDGASFVSGSPLELLRHLDVVASDVDGFLDAAAALLGGDRRPVASDDRPPRAVAAAGQRRRDFYALQNRAILERFRSADPLGFRGAPTPDEELLARAAFSRGSIPRLARAWATSSSASLAASSWLYDELGAKAAAELRSSVDAVGAWTAAASTVTSCEPIPRFVSRLDRVDLSVLERAGASVDGTQPLDAVDGTFDPLVGRGWRARPESGAVSLTVELASPARIETVYLVIRPIDDGRVSVRLFGREPSGTWYPLASEDGPPCRGARRFQLGASTPALDALRVELDGAGVALHELWAETS